MSTDTEMVSVTKKDANNYCRILRLLEINETDADPVAVIQMWQGWESDARADCEALGVHLRAVLEIARTWQPEYATAMDLQTIEQAKDFLSKVQP